MISVVVLLMLIYVLLHLGMVCVMSEYLQSFFGNVKIQQLPHFNLDTQMLFLIIGGMQHVVCVPRAKVPIVRLFDPELYVLSCLDVFYIYIYVS